MSLWGSIKSGWNYFKSAKVDRGSQAWQPSTLDGENAIANDLDMLLARSRDLAVNSATGKRIAECLSDLIVGSGMVAFACPFEMDLAKVLADTLTDEQLINGLEYMLENAQAFDRWAEHADSEGDSDWYQLEKLACHELIKTGDAILMECHVPHRRREIDLCYQLIEKDQLDTTKDRPGGAGENRIINGIEYDGMNRKVAYHIYDAHPGSENPTLSSSRVPASRINHTYMRFRPSQRSGYPWHQEAFQAIRDGDWFLSSALKKAAIQALLVLVLKSPRHAQAAGLLDGLAGSDQYGNTKIKLGSAVLSRMNTDEDLEQFETKQGVESSQAFWEQIRAEQGMGGGISPSRLTRDYRGHSYTAARAAHLDDDAHIKPVQKWFCRQISIPIRRRFTEIYAARNLFATVTAREFVRDYWRYTKFNALGPGREQLDPEKETSAASERMRSGVSTLEIENGRRQQYWVQVLMQLGLEAKVAERVGVKLDFGGSSQQQQDTASSMSDEDLQNETEERALWQQPSPSR